MGESIRRFTKRIVGFYEGVLGQAADVLDTTAWAMAYAGPPEVQLLDLPARTRVVCEWIPKAGDRAEAWMDANLFPDLAPETGLFTIREIGQLQGELGVQVALSFVAVEEVKLTLKAVAAADQARSIVELIEANPDGWTTDPQFWIAVASAVLFLVGLSDSTAGRKLVTIFVQAAPKLMAGVPAMTRLAKQRADVRDPDRRKAVVQDVHAVVLAASKAMLQIVNDARSTPATTTPSALEPPPRGGSSSNDTQS